MRRKSEIDQRDDERFVQELNAGSRRYRRSGVLIISGVAMIALSAGVAEKSDPLGALVAAVGILLLLAGSIAQGD
jgi:hypothetical protein